MSKVTGIVLERGRGEGTEDLNPGQSGPESVPLTTMVLGENESTMGPWGPKPSLRVSPIPRHDLFQEERSISGRSQ